MKCRCVAGPSPVYDEVNGEIVCDTCAVVMEEKEAQIVWNGMSMQGGSGPRAAARVTKYITTQRIADGSTNAARDALLRKLMPILEHVSASGIIRNEAVMLIKRMSADGFAKGKPRLNLCAGVVLATCRVHGRVIKREKIAEISCTDFKKVSRAARSIIEQYNLEPLSIEELTRRIISRMCTDIGEPALLRLALRTYESMLLTGYTSGKHPYVVAIKALRAHTMHIMSDARLATAIGVPYKHMYRYAEMMQNVC